MNVKPVVHASFTLERTYRVSPARVFAAFADSEIKARWFIGPDGWRVTERRDEFRVGGQEVLAGVFPDGRTSRYDARYYEIIPDARLVYAYDMHHGGIHLSLSLVTIELQQSGSGTHLLLTEQDAYLNGEDGSASRAHGTGWHLDNLGKVLG
ncbi:MAG: SRPBCC family protein [Pseudomonadota bacterium]